MKLSSFEAAKVLETELKPSDPWTYIGIPNLALQELTYSMNSLNEATSFAEKNQCLVSKPMIGSTACDLLSLSFASKCGPVVSLRNQQDFGSLYLDVHPA